MPIAAMRLRKNAAAPPVVAAWDPASSGALLNFSESNRLATKSTGDGFSTAKASIARPASEHRYFEIEVVSALAQFMLVGVGTASAPVTSFPGSTADGWGYYMETGQKYTNNVPSSYGPAWFVGDVIGVEINAGTLTFWRNGVSLGAAFTGITGDLYPLGSPWRTGDALRIRLTSAQISSLPSGASTWA